MKLVNLVLLVVILNICYMPFPLIGAENPSKDVAEPEIEQGEDIPYLNPEEEKKLDELQEKTSNLLLNAAEWIDSFFDDRRFLIEENKTRAKFSLSFGYSRHYDFEVKPRLSLRLRLPRLEKQTQLFLLASEDEDFDIEDNPILNPSIHDNADNDEIVAGIQRFAYDRDNFKLSYGLGVSIDYIYGSARLRASHMLGDYWQGRLINRLRYYTDEGWENVTTYDLETFWEDKWFFRTTTAVLLSEEKEETEGVPHGQSIQVTQVLSEYQALLYEAGIYFRTKPSYKMSNVGVILKYRQRFYRDWLTLEISPRVDFPEEHDNEINPGIVVKFEASFGYKTDEGLYRSIFY